jgi:hypothetical protein
VSIRERSERFTDGEANAEPSAFSLQVFRGAVPEANGVSEGTRREKGGTLTLVHPRGLT